MKTFNLLLIHSVTIISRQKLVFNLQSSVNLEVLFTKSLHQNIEKLHRYYWRSVGTFWCHVDLKIKVMVHCREKVKVEPSL